MNILPQYFHIFVFQYFTAWNLGLFLEIFWYFGDNDFLASKPARHARGYIQLYFISYVVLEGTDVNFSQNVSQSGTSTCSTPLFSQLCPVVDHLRRCYERSLCWVTSYFFAVGKHSMHKRLKRRCFVLIQICSTQRQTPPCFKTEVFLYANILPDDLLIEPGLLNSRAGRKSQLIQ